MVDIVIQMCPKCGEDPLSGCSNAVSVEDQRIPSGLCSINILKSTKESSHSRVTEPRVPGFVYKRKKRQLLPKNFWFDKTPADTRRIAGSYPTICLKIPSIVEGQASRAPILPSSDDAKPTSTCASKLEHGSNEKPIQAHKIIDVDSINDSCSSKSNAEHVSVPLKTRTEESGECSSSMIALEAQEDKSLSDSAVIATEAHENTPLSERDICISMLQNEFLLQKAKSSAIFASSENGNEKSRINSCSDCSRKCKACSCSEIARKMLICDSCDEAFHISCCNSKERSFRDDDEWFCSSCLTKKHMHMKQTVNMKKLTRTGSVADRSRATPAAEKPSLISLMLRDTGPYQSNVRVGKGFQADVPEWSGPVKGDDKFGEVEELDTSVHVFPHVPNPMRPSNLSSIGNWLQCKQVINDGERIICGKWRRAPLFQVQTDDWECFCSVFWDPSHADCAAPQEIDTEQVLKQLKYLEMLRPRLASKRRKLVRPQLDGSKKSIGTHKKYIEKGGL